MHSKLYRASINPMPGIACFLLLLVVVVVVVVIDRYGLGPQSKVVRAACQSGCDHSLEPAS